MLALHEEIERLPRAYRSAVVLCYLEGMTYQAVATQLGLTVSTVRGRLERARRRLRERLVRRNLEMHAGCLIAALSGGLEGTLPSGRLAASVSAFKPSFGGGSCSGISPHVLTIGRGVLRTMFLQQLKTAVALVLGLAVLTGGACLLYSRDARARPQAVRPLPALFQATVSQGSLTPGSQAKGKETKASPATRLDPELVTRAGGTIVATAPITKDCMVLSYIPDWNHGDVDNIGIGNYDGGYRTLLDWKPFEVRHVRGERPSLPARAFARKSTGTEAPGPILAFMLTEEWPERTSWRGMPSYDPEPAATFKFEPGDGWKLFDITPVIRAQARSGRNGHGILLRFMNEDRSPQKSHKAEYYFASREAQGPDSTRRPIILVVKP